MSDLGLIKQIEQKIGKQLVVASKFDLIFSDNGYALNEQQQLIGLNLDSCKLIDIAFLSQFSRLQDLSLCNNQIIDLTALKELKNLTDLYLVDNQITDLTALKELKNLNGLYLSNNLITDLTPLKELKNLTGLYLLHNQITEIAALKELKNLIRLILSYNQIRELPEWLFDFDLEIKLNGSGDGLFIKGNPLEYPPIEIIKQGNAAIKVYFDSLRPRHNESTDDIHLDIQMDFHVEINKKLNELKVLFVGDGKAGKTSLSKVLRGETFNPQESQTHGINIDHWQHQDLTLHFWDFGGQETMHATHQFFLSKRSLYILVLDGRKEEDAEYWLKHIESFGGSSPVLIVLNKMDEHLPFDVNRKHLLDK